MSASEYIDFANTASVSILIKTIVFAIAFLDKHHAQPYTPNACQHHMAEQEKHLQQPPQLHLAEGSSLRLTDGTHNLDVRKDGDTLLMQVSRAEHSLFSIAISPNSRVHQVFDAAAHAPGTADQFAALASKETTKAPEYPPITVEGFAGRNGAYRTSEVRPGEMEYYVYLYYRPTPDEDWKFTIPYHVHFFGAAAEGLKQQKIGTGARLRISGELHAKQVIGKEGEKKERFDVYANQYEFFKGKPKPMENETRRPN